MKTILACLVFLVVALIPKSALSYPKSSTQIKIEKGPVLLMKQVVLEIFHFDYAIEGAFVARDVEIDKASSSNVEALLQMIKERREYYQGANDEETKRHGKDSFSSERYIKLIERMTAVETALQKYPFIFERVLEPSRFLMSQSELLENANIKNLNVLINAGSYYAQSNMNDIQVAQKMVASASNAVVKVLTHPEFENSLNFSYALKVFPDSMATLNLTFDPTNLSREDFVKAVVAERLAYSITAADMFAGKDLREHIREVEMMAGLKNILNSIQNLELRSELAVAIGHRTSLQVKNPGIKFLAGKLSNLYDIDEVKPLSSAREEVSMYGSYKRKKIFFVLPYDSLFAQNVKENLAKNSWANTVSQMNISEEQLSKALAFLNPKEYIRQYQQREEVGLVPMARDIEAGLRETEKEQIALIKEWMNRDSDPKRFSDIYNPEDAARTESRQIKIIIANSVRYIIVEMPYTLLKDLKTVSKKAVGYTGILAAKSLRASVALFVPNGVRLLDLTRVALAPAVISIWNGTPVLAKAAWFGSQKLVKLLTIDLVRRSVLTYSYLSTEAAARPLSFADEADRVHQRKDSLGNPLLSCEAVFR